MSINQSQTSSQTVYNTKGTRAQTHRELIRKWLWEPKGSSLEYIETKKQRNNTGVQPHTGKAKPIPAPSTGSNLCIAQHTYIINWKRFLLSAGRRACRRVGWGGAGECSCGAPAAARLQPVGLTRVPTPEGSAGGPIE